MPKVSNAFGFAYKSEICKQNLAKLCTPTMSQVSVHRSWFCLQPHRNLDTNVSNFYKPWWQSVAHLWCAQLCIVLHTKGDKSEICKQNLAKLCRANLRFATLKVWDSCPCTEGAWGRWLCHQGYALLTFGVQSFASLLTFGVQWSIILLTNQWFVSNMMHRFAYNSEICKQNQQALLTNRRFATPSVKGKTKTSKTLQVQTFGL